MIMLMMMMMMIIPQCQFPAVAPISIDTLPFWSSQLLQVPLCARGWQYPVLHACPGHPPAVHWAPLLSCRVPLSGGKTTQTAVQHNRMHQIHDWNLQMFLKSPVVRSTWSALNPSGAELAFSVPRPVSLLTDVLLSRDTEEKIQINELIRQDKYLWFLITVLGIGIMCIIVYSPCFNLDSWSREVFFFSNNELVSSKFQGSCGCGPLFYRRT